MSTKSSLSSFKKLHPTKAYKSVSQKWWKARYFYSVMLYRSLISHPTKKDSLYPWIKLYLMLAKPDLLLKMKFSLELSHQTTFKPMSSDTSLVVLNGPDSQLMLVGLAPLVSMVSYTGWEHSQYIQTWKPRVRAVLNWSCLDLTKIGF